MMWDARFLGLAEHISGWSKDPSKKVGAVIVDENKIPRGMGYNGFPRGIADDHRLDDRDTKLSIVVHAELNAILNANMTVRGCTLYVWPFFCCERCAVHVIQAGIVRVVTPWYTEHAQSKWFESWQRANNYFEEAGVVTDAIFNFGRLNARQQDLRDVLITTIREDLLQS